MSEKVFEAKRKLIKKFGAVCFYCGGPLGRFWERDHVIPKSRGGKDRASNRVPACRNCNAMKLDLTMEEWFARMILILKRFKRINEAKNRD